VTKSVTLRVTHAQYNQSSWIYMLR